jgi:N-acetylmuramoyl-L-alanine amidase
MKSSIFRLAGLFTAATVFSAVIPNAQATTFGEIEIDQSEYVAVAAPYGDGLHQLLIIGQMTDEKPCWSESGSNPVIVDPLLVKFDFTGICDRKTDANGYSIRIDGEDQAQNYSLRIRQRGGDLVLVGSPPPNSQGQEIEIGRANGVTNSFAKIQLDPDWRFTKRTFEKKTLGHIYLTKGVSQIPFPDVENDIYLKEIRDAVALKFVSGFEEDNTFRPNTPLTREQLVSLVLESLKNVPGVTLNVPTSTSQNPYPDVVASRWSAPKIAFAKENKIVEGYPGGEFRPAQTVTRAEMMAVLRRAAEYTKNLKGLPPELQVKQTAFNFTDTANHPWASSLIRQMSSYCGVASPLNERGQAFMPDEASQRNYAAAATLRTLNCLKSEVNGATPTAPTPGASPAPKGTTPAPEASPKLEVAPTPEAGSQSETTPAPAASPTP